MNRLSNIAFKGKKNAISASFPPSPANVSACGKSSHTPPHSFSLDTVAQMNISDLPVKAFTRYLLKQVKRSTKLAERNKCKRLFEKKLRKFGYVEQADKLKRCSANITLLICGNRHTFRPTVDYRCHLPFCPSCWELKSNRELGKQLPKFLQALKDDPSLLVVLNTLTLKSKKDRKLRAGNDELKKDFKALRRRDIWEKCVGGIGRIENTFSAKHSWHPHLHSVLLVKDFIPQERLSNEWNSITGDSMIVDIRRVTDIAAGLVEAIKYPFKPADLGKLGKNEIQEMLDSRGARLGVTFGVLFGIEVADDIEETIEDEYSEFIEETKVLEIGDPCPICGSKLVLSDFSAAEYVNLLASLPFQSHARGKPH